MKYFIILFIIPTALFAQTYSWTEVDSLNEPRNGHAMVVLSDGNVLVSGNGSGNSKSCEIYDINSI